MKKTVVLGVGNELFKDEGVGVHTVRILQSELPSSVGDVEVIDSGTSPDIWPLVDGADKGSKPEETVIIGVEPVELGLGLELSTELEERMPKIIKTVLGEISPRVETKV
jgi:Ni,Fe-hydrogenase maturation factor